MGRGPSNGQQQTSIHAPVNQSVKVDVSVRSGADPREIGVAASKAIGVELEKERRNAYEALLQKAPKS